VVKRALEGLKGVKKAEVSFERAEAIVTYERGSVTLEQMSRAVEQYGYKAKPK
jgi:copper chaperone CopZ